MSVEPTSGNAVLHRAMAGLAGGLAGMLAVAGLVGCSSDPASGGQTPGPPSSDRISGEQDAAVRRAADVLSRSGTSRARTSMEMRHDGKRVTITGKGMFDYGRQRGWLKVTLPGTARAGATRGPITELVVPGALYMRNRGPQVPEGKWVRVSTGRLADGNLVTGGATDPITAAELLRGARDVELVGTETLDGVRVRHFRGAADMAEAAERATEASSKALRAATRSFTETSVPFDVYLDERGRLRKVRQEFTFRSASAAKGERARVRVVSTTELFDFGTEKVDVTVPEGADIYDGKIVSPAAPDGS